jgi:RND family efflux transporter MFP subunit
MKINLKLTILVVLALVLFGSLAILGKSSAQSATGTTLKYNSKKDTLYTPKIATIQDALTVAGSISTDQAAVLRFQNSGKLIWVGVKIGDKVKKGQAIASLDKEELRKNLQTQYNNYRSQLSQFNDVQDQYQTTKNNFLVTDTIQRILDRTQYSLNNSVINYEITDMAIKESTLISPVDGIVVAIDQPLAGANVTPATATFTIINPNSIYFKANIDQDSINQVKVGQKVTLILDSFPNDTLNSEVTYIAFSPVPGETSTVYETRFKLPVANNDLSYRLGMDGNVTLILSQADNALTVPIDAVNDDNGQRYVYVKNNQELIRHNVKVGIETDTTSQITEGLSQNDQVAIIQK